MGPRSKGLKLMLLAAQLLAVPALADEAADKTEAAKKVIAVAFSRGNYKKMSDSVSEQLPEELRPELVKILPSYQEMVDFQIGLFVKYYTPDELNEIARFYASPTGKKTTKVMPEIMADAQGFVMQRLQTELPKVMARLKKAKAAGEAKEGGAAPAAEQKAE